MSSPIDPELIPLDTTPSAYAAQADIYRRLGGKERLAIVYRLNETTRQLSMAGIRSRHPEYTDDQVHRAYHRLVLGDELMRRVWPFQELIDP